jgi:hypothetical protein
MRHAVRMRVLFVLCILCSTPVLATAKAAASTVETVTSVPAAAATEEPMAPEYAHFYRVACIPPLKYFAITREDYRGEAVTLAKQNSAREQLVPFGLYATSGFGTCVIGDQRIAWNVGDGDFRTHIALNDITLVDGLAILPEDDSADPMVSGFELVLDAEQGTHELAVHGVWKEPSQKQKKKIGLVLDAARAKKWFPRCDAAVGDSCTSYHFIQFPAASALPKKAEKRQKTGIMPGRPSSNLHTK